VVKITVSIGRSHGEKVFTVTTLRKSGKTKGAIMNVLPWIALK
jgi:hypothetical protein